MNLQATPTTEEIWRTLSDRLRRFIQSRVKSRADADDILQEVFLRVQQKLDSLQQQERLESWVFQIARNAIVDNFRKSNSSHDHLDPKLLPVPDESETGGDLNGDVAGWLPLLIERLPESQRRAVTMYELEGVPQQEIARRESISLSGAKSRVQRGREALETMLRDCCRFDLDRRRNIVACEPVNCDLGECADACD